MNALPARATCPRRALCRPAPCLIPTPRRRRSWNALNFGIFSICCGGALLILDPCENGVKIGREIVPEVAVAKTQRLNLLALAQLVHGPPESHHRTGEAMAQPHHVDHGQWQET